MRHNNRFSQRAPRPTSAPRIRRAQRRTGRASQSARTLSQPMQTVPWFGTRGAGVQAPLPVVQRSSSGPAANIPMTGPLEQGATNRQRQQVRALAVTLLNAVSVAKASLFFQLLVLKSPFNNSMHRLYEGPLSLPQDLNMSDQNFENAARGFAQQLTNLNIHRDVLGRDSVEAHGGLVLYNLTNYAQNVLREVDSAAFSESKARTEIGVLQGMLKRVGEYQVELTIASKKAVSMVYNIMHNVVQQNHARHGVLGNNNEMLGYDLREVNRLVSLN